MEAMLISPRRGVSNEWVAQYRALCRKGTQKKTGADPLARSVDPVAV
jgi:hypothetical protein